MVAGAHAERIAASQNSVEDERRLRAGAPAVRAAVLSDRSLSVGVGVRGEPGYVGRARRAGLAIVRRSTGGSGVLHLPGDLVWSIVLPRDDPEVGRDFARAYVRLGRGVGRFLAAQGVDARWVPAPGEVEECCVLSSRGQVLEAGGRILGGAAQHATRAALLHQGMIARRIDPELLDRIFGIPPATARTRLAGTDELGVHATPETLARALRDALAVEFLRPSSPGRAGPVRP